MKTKSKCYVKLIVFFLVLIPWQKTAFSQPELIRFRPGARAVALGGSSITETYDPTAIYWNPAQTAEINYNKILFSMPDLYILNFLGYSHFFPLSGTASFALAQTSREPGAFNIGTIAWAAKLNRYFAAGVNFGYYKIGDESWNIMGIGFIFRPQSISYKLIKSKNNSFWESSFLADRLALGFSVQNIPLGDTQNIDHQVRLGLSYRFTPFSPVFTFTQHFNRNKDTNHSGLEIPISQGIRLLTGIQDLDLNKFAAGCGLTWENLEFHLTCSQEFKQVQFSFAARLGKSSQVMVQDEYENAAEFIKQKDYRSALTSLKKALAYDQYHIKTLKSYEIVEKRVLEENAHIDSLLAVSYKLESAKQFISAAENYYTILQSYPDHEIARTRLKFIAPQLKVHTDSLYLTGINLFEQDELIQSKDVFEKILIVRKEHMGSQAYLKRINDLLNKRSEDSYLRGLGFYVKKNFERAIQDFNTALKYNPNHQEALRYLAQVHEEVNQKQDEVKQLLSQGERYLKTEDFIKAKQVIDEVLRLDPDNTRAKELVTQLQQQVEQFIWGKIKEGKSLFETGKYSQALATFNIVLLIQPRHATALEYCRQINTITRDEANKLFQEGKTYYQNGNHELALQKLKAAIAIYPDHSEANILHARVSNQLNVNQLIEQGKSEFLNGHYKEAKIIFDKVVKDDPENPTGIEFSRRIKERIVSIVEDHFTRGIKFYTEEKYNTAIEEWKKALELNPEHKGALEYTKRANERLQAITNLKDK